MAEKQNNNEDKVTKQEFTQWLKESAELAEKTADNGKKTDRMNSTRRYYVYALCERINGRLIPFYIGKGSGDRVWAHKDGEEKEREEIEKEYTDEEERRAALDALSAKYKRIAEIKDRLEKIIIKTGLTEYESFMCESALINLFRMDELQFDSMKEPLTNGINGHRNIVEEQANLKTAAYPIDYFFKQYCKKPIILEAREGEEYYHITDSEINKDFLGKSILLQNINNTYPECIDKTLFPTEQEQNEAIREAVRGVWRRTKTPDTLQYVFAMYEGRIVGIYEVDKEVCRTVKGQKQFFRSIDVWHDQFPVFEKLTARKENHTIASMIYEDCIKKGIINEENFKKNYFKAEVKDTLYSKLSEDVQKKICELIDAIKDEDDEATRNKKLKTWVERKFIVLKDTSDFSKYIKCAIMIKDGNNKYRSIFGPREECVFLPKKHTK